MRERDESTESGAKGGIGRRKGAGRGEGGGRERGREIRGDNPKRLSVLDMINASHACSYVEDSCE